MTWFQPDGESGPRTESGLPAFPVVRRGYDRQQVDAYATESAARLEEVSGRLNDAERARAQMQRELAAMREQPPPSFKQLGAEAAMVLEQAGRSAEQLIENASGRAETIVKEAQVQAVDIVKAAERQAGQFDATAREHLAEVQADTEHVREFREGLLLYLGKVRTDIDALLDEAAKKADRPAVAAASKASEPQPVEATAETSIGAGPE